MGNIKPVYQRERLRSTAMLCRSLYSKTMTYFVEDSSEELLGLISSESEKEIEVKTNRASNYMIYQRGSLQEKSPDTKDDCRVSINETVPNWEISSFKMNKLSFSENSIQKGSARFSIRDDAGGTYGNRLQVDFVWSRCENEVKEVQKSFKRRQEVCEVPINAFLTIRLDLESYVNRIVIYLQGGSMLGVFSFPEGHGAAIAFMTTLRKYVDTTILTDEFNCGELFAIERKSVSNWTSVPASEYIPNEEECDSASLLILQTGSGKYRNTDTKHNAGRLSRFFLFSRACLLAKGMTGFAAKMGNRSRTAKNYEGKMISDQYQQQWPTIYCESNVEDDFKGLNQYCPNQIRENPRGVPLSISAWKMAFDSAGKLIDPAVLKHSVFTGGVEANARALVWPFLLGLYPWSSSDEDRMQLMRKRREEYMALKTRWNILWSLAREEERHYLLSHSEGARCGAMNDLKKEHADCLEAAKRIKKDVARTHRTSMRGHCNDGHDALSVQSMETMLNVYAMYNRSVSYCQGMADFLSPLVDVLGADDEPLTFWCFVGLMSRVEGNFRTDETGIKSQLLKLKTILSRDKQLSELFKHADPDFCSCFRWVILQFKRELPFSATLRLWEVLWTRPVDDDLHIFVTAAILLAHRQELLSLSENSFDCILRFVNDLNMCIDIDYALQDGCMYSKKFSYLVSGSNSC